MKQPIRILHVLGRLDRGGAETMVMNLYRSMDRERIQFDFILHTTDECSYTKEVHELGGRIYAVPAYSLKTAGTYRKAWKTFFAEHPEYRILHSHVRSTASLYLPLAKRYGLTTIIHSHNTCAGAGIAALVKRILQYPLRFQADYLFACGRKAGEWLFGKKACASKRFILLPNAIDLSHFLYSSEVRKGIRERLGIAEGTFVAGHIGRFEEQKNHTFLIEVFAALHQSVPDSILLLLGEGPLEQQIHSITAAHNLEQAVWFMGSRSDVPELLQGMDVLIFPSVYEGLPVTLIEAQATGITVIASENVTREVILTDLVKQLSLKDSAVRWAQRAAAAVCPVQEGAGNAGPDSRVRTARTEAIRAAGYGIEETAGWLADFYIKQAVKHKE